MPYGIRVSNIVTMLLHELCTDPEYQDVWDDLRTACLHAVLTCVCNALLHALMYVACTGLCTESCDVG